MPVTTSQPELDHEPIEALQFLHGDETSPEECARIEFEIIEALVAINARAASNESDIALFAADREANRVADIASEPDDDEPDAGEPPPESADTTASTPPKGRFALTWFDDIKPGVVKKSFIKGVFAENEFTSVSGLPGSGKSAIVTDAACHVAAGMSWHGRKVTQGLVVFVAAERKSLTERRMLAFKMRHKVERVPLLVMGGRIDLTSANLDARAIVTAIKEAETACGMSCVWIIVDTLTRTFGPGDQNTSKDMGRYVANCDIVREGVGAHVSVIHHTGWNGDRGKGAIDLDGAVDASFLVKKNPSSYALICDGTNDGDEGAICLFNMESVTIGVDEDGEPTTAPVIVPCDAADEPVVFSPSAFTAKALETLAAARRWGGRVDLEVWRKGFYGAYPTDKPGTLKTRFLRARDVLLRTGAVSEIDGAFEVVASGTNGTSADDVPCAA